MSACNPHRETLTRLPIPPFGSLKKREQLHRDYVRDISGANLDADQVPLSKGRNISFSAPLYEDPYSQN